MSINYFTNSSKVDASRIIYTPSFFAKSSLFYLQETGKLKALSLHKSLRENLKSYLFFIVKDGEGELVYNGESFELCKNDCIFLDCQKKYSHATSLRFWTLKWIHFYGVNMGNIYEKYKNRGGKVVFHPQKLYKYENKLDELYEVATSVSYVKDMKIHEKISGLLVLLMEDSWNPTDNKYLGKVISVYKIKEYLDMHYNEKISLDKLASVFYINKFYMTDLFKRQYGVTINEYLINIRITKGKEMLRFSDKPIEEIAINCGINNPYYFSRLFKKIEGISPSGYRKKW